MGASPMVVLNGESSNFDFSVSNRDPSFICCQADHVTVLLCCPDANGNEPLPVCVGGSTPGASCGQNLDCPGDATHPPGTCNLNGCRVLDADTTFLGANDPSGLGGEVRQYNNNLCTVNVNNGVTSATAGSHAVSKFVRTGFDNHADAHHTDSVNVLTCSVALDKQVSCQGGAPGTFVDVGEHDNVTQSCTGDVGANDILVRYVVHNTGTSGLSNCQYTDTNAVVGVPGTPSPLPVSIGAGAAPASATTSLLQCDTARAGGEPDPLSVTCTCAASPTGASATDSYTASFE